MLDSQLVRVGFVTQLNWRRYGHFWQALVESAGLTAVFADPGAVRERLVAPELAHVPALAFRVAAAQALVLAECDALVVPRLVRETRVARGAGQDPWVMDFGGSLRSTLPGMQALTAVPSWFDESVESLAFEFMQAQLHDAALVRRALDRTRPYARAPRVAAPNLVRLPGQTRTVALLGQPWLVTDALEKLASRPGEHVVGQHRLDPEELREEGLREDARLVDSDAEVLGAARMLGRRSAVSLLRLVVDEGSGSDAWLARRVGRGAHKPFEVVTLQELLADRDLVDTLMDPRLD